MIDDDDAGTRLFTSPVYNGVATHDAIWRRHAAHGDTHHVYLTTRQYNNIRQCVRQFRGLRWHIVHIVYDCERHLVLSRMFVARLKRLRSYRSYSLFIRFTDFRVAYGGTAYTGCAYTSACTVTHTAGSRHTVTCHAYATIRRCRLPRRNAYATAIMLCVYVRLCDNDNNVTMNLRTITVITHRRYGCYRTMYGYDCDLPSDDTIRLR